MNQKYIIRDRECGNYIDEFNTEEEALKVLKEYEEDDKANYCFTPDFYEIVPLYWFAIISDDDNDWGTGSYNLEESKEKCQRYGKNYYIAVINERSCNDPICVKEIRQEDF